MKKKIALILVLCIMATVLCSCSTSNNYPHIRILNTMWKMDNFNIPIGSNYALDVRKPYEITFSDDGAIVNIYFMKKGIE